MTKQVAEVSMEKFKNILLSQDFFPEVGGAHLWMYEVYKRWPEKVAAFVKDYRLHPALSERQTIFDQLDHENLYVIRHNNSIDNLNLLSFQFYFKCWKTFKMLNRYCSPETVTLHCLRAYPEGLVASLYKRLNANKPRLVMYAHGEEIVTAKTSRQLNWMAKLAFHSSDCIIANSQSTQKLINNFCGLENVSIVYPGVNIDTFNATDTEVKVHRQKWGFNDKDIVLFSISRMEPRKNHSRILRALAELRAQGLSLSCVLASEGEEKLNLQQQAHDLGISEFVIFPGYIDDHERVLSFFAADIHIQPSIQSGSMIEGFGIVFIEAAASGTPSIAGNIGGQSEAVLEGETGFVVDGTNQEQINNSIARLAVSSELRQKMGKAGLIWAKKNDWRNISKKTTSIVGELSN